MICTDILTHTIHVLQDEFLPEDDCRRIVAACEAAVESDAFITSQQVRGRGSVCEGKERGPFGGAGVWRAPCLSLSLS